MKAELIIMGKRLDMAPRTHRRALVVWIFAGLVGLMASLWLLDRWRVTGAYMIFATILINRLLLGGYNFGGLVKPFSGKAPRAWMEPPPFLALGLRVYNPVAEEGEYRNDERELQQRDRAHYFAYQGLTIGLLVIWLAANAQAFAPRLLAWIPGSAGPMVYGLTLMVVVLSQTLPQAILLWNEPDLAEFGPEE
jgi:hypothetical protein